MLCRCSHGDHDAAVAHLGQFGHDGAAASLGSLQRSTSSLYLTDDARVWGIDHHRQRAEQGAMPQ